MCKPKPGLVDVRPIVVAEPLLKLAAVVNYNLHSRRALSILLASGQFALSGERGGGPGLLAAAQAAISAAGDDAVVLSMDMKKRFRMCSPGRYFR